MNILPERIRERLIKSIAPVIEIDSLVSIPQDAAVQINYGGYPQNEIAIINKLQNQQQVDQALSRIKTNLQKPSVSAEDATFDALNEVKSRYLQEPSEVQDFIIRRLDEVGAFVPPEEFVEDVSSVVESPDEPKSE